MGSASSGPGRPAQGIIFTPRDGYLIPFSLVWCGFAVYWTFMATNAGAPGFFTLWGLLFVCIGVFFVAGRFAAEAWIRRGIYYAITNRRVLISRAGPVTSFIAISINQIPDIQLDERSDASGTIRCGHAASIWGNRGISYWMPSLDPVPQFLAIGDTRQVLNLIQQARQ